MIPHIQTIYSWRNSANSSLDLYAAISQSHCDILPRAIPAGVNLRSISVVSIIRYSPSPTIHSCVGSYPDSYGPNARLRRVVLRTPLPLCRNGCEIPFDKLIGSLSPFYKKVFTGVPNSIRYADHTPFYEVTRIMRRNKNHHFASFWRVNVLYFVPSTGIRKPYAYFETKIKSPTSNVGTIDQRVSDRTRRAKPLSARKLVIGLEKKE